MILVFVDETSDAKFKDYFGLCCTVVTHTFYRQIKYGFQSILLEGGWDPSIEFKGSYLFSASKGCTHISVDKRVDMAEAIIDLNVAKKNARMKFGFFQTESQDLRADYLRYLPALLFKVLPKATKGQGKDLISIQYDERSDISPDEVRESILPVIFSKEYTLLEDIVQISSNFETVGLAYADIVGYLMARVETISNNSELFENVPLEVLQKTGKFRKLQSSFRIIEKIKNLSIYKVEGK